MQKHLRDSADIMAESMDSDLTRESTFPSSSSTTHRKKQAFVMQHDEHNTAPAYHPHHPSLSLASPPVPDDHEAPGLDKTVVRSIQFILSLTPQSCSTNARTIIFEQLSIVSQFQFPRREHPARRNSKHKVSLNTPPSHFATDTNHCFYPDNSLPNNTQSDCYNASSLPSRAMQMRNKKTKKRDVFHAELVMNAVGLPRKQKPKTPVHPFHANGK